LADESVNVFPAPLRFDQSIRYIEDIGIVRVNGRFTRIRHPDGTRRRGFLGMPTRRFIRAIAPGATAARPDAALILGGLLLLISP
jgi:hypothetical protein